MLRLVYKDFMLIKKSAFFLLIFSLYFDFMGLRSPSLSGIVYILGMALFAYIFMLYANGYDDKNKGEIIFNSMPVKRSSLVLGKYLDIIFFIIFAGIIFMASSEIMKVLFAASSVNITGRSALISDAVYALTALGIYFSLYFPFYFKLGGLRLQAFNQITYMLFILMPYVISRIFTKYRDNKIVSSIMNINLENLKIILVLAAALIFLLSLMISISIYNSRDL